MDGARTERLRARLREFWSGFDGYLDNPTQTDAGEKSLRARAAAFVPQGSRILDIACGRGTNSVYLSPRGNYFGTDISLNFLRRAASRDLHLTCADGEALPFAAESFDAVISTYALEHSVEPVRMLREMWRVARRDGRIILLGPAWDFPFWYPNALLSRAKNRRWRLVYTAKRAAGQLRAMLGGTSPFVIVEEPDALTRPFVYDSDAVYIVWTYEVIRTMKALGSKLILGEADTPLLGGNPLVRITKRVLMKFPAYRYAGSTVLLVFEKSQTR